MTNIIGNFSSVLLYIIILLICLILSYLAEKRQKLNVWIFLLIITLSVFCGMRGSSVGVDVAHYIIRHIEPISNGMFNYVSQPIGFKLIVWSVYQFTNNTHWVFIVFAIITNTLIILRLWDFKKICSFPMMVLWYYVFFYIVSFNIFRQFVAIALVFFATRYLEKEKIIKYCFLVACAVSIHTISILGFFLIPIYVLCNKSIDVKKKKYKKYFLLLLPVIVGIAAVALYYYFDFDHYLYLLNRENVNGISGISIPFRFVLALENYRMIKANYIASPKTNGYSDDYRIISLITFIGLGINLLAFIASEAERFTYYFSVFEILFVSFRIQKGKYKQIIKFLYVLFAIYTLYSRFSSNGLQILPYVTTL